MVEDLTALVLTYNEAANIGRTLQRLTWVREVLVVDSFSTDETVAIVRRFPNTRVVQRRFDTFATQCNFGLDQISTTWVLSLDADYVLSEELIAEVQSLFKSGGSEQPSGYSARFRYWVAGRPLRASLYPPRTVLYRKGKARYHNEGHGHRVSVDGGVQRLSGFIEHDDRKPFDRWLTQQDRYAMAEARYLLARPRDGLSFADRVRRKVVLAPGLVLLYTLFWKGLWLDGWAGCYYVFQRVLAEVLVSLRLLEGRWGAGARKHAEPEESRAGRWCWRLTALCLACYWGLLIYQLGAQWSVYEQYHYGWAVPALCGLLLWRNRTAGKDGTGLAGWLPAPTRMAVPKTSGSRFLLGGTVAVLGVVYGAARLVHEANPIWRLTSWALALDIVGMTLLLAWWSRTVGPARVSDDQASGVSQPVSEHSGYQASPVGQQFSSCLGGAVFPVCFFLVAVPWPSRLETAVVSALSNLNASAAVELLGLLGVPAIQHQNTIEVASGAVGVEEACSGIRSLQAALMVSLLLGAWFRLGVMRRVGLVLSGLGLAVGLNVARTTLLSWVAAGWGQAAMSRWHDAGGTLIVLGCFGLLWAIACRLGRGAAANPTGVQPLTGRIQRGVPALGGRVTRRRATGMAAAALLGWFVLVEAATQAWYGAHEAHGTAAAGWFPVAAGPGRQRAGAGDAVPGAVARQFRADESRAWRWEDGAGYQWQVFYFRWWPSRALGKRVAAQLARSHGPETCLPALGLRLESYAGLVRVEAGGEELWLHQYVFRAGEEAVHVFFGIYEDGPRPLLVEGRGIARRLGAAWEGKRTYGQRYLELAVRGPTDAREARAAVSHWAWERTWRSATAWRLDMSATSVCNPNPNPNRNRPQQSR